MEDAKNENSKQKKGMHPKKGSTGVLLKADHADNKARAPTTCRQQVSNTLKTANKPKTNWNYVCFIIKTEM